MSGLIDCERAFQLLSLSQDQALHSTETVMLEEHLEGCLRCRRQQDALSSLTGQLRTATAPDVDLATLVAKSSLDPRAAWRSAVRGSALMAGLMAGTAMLGVSSRLHSLSSDGETSMSRAVAPLVSLLSPAIFSSALLHLLVVVALLVAAGWLAGWRQAREDAGFTLTISPAQRRTLGLGVLATVLCVALAIGLERVWQAQGSDVVRWAHLVAVGAGLTLLGTGISLTARPLRFAMPLGAIILVSTVWLLFGARPTPIEWSDVARANPEQVKALVLNSHQWLTCRLQLVPNLIPPLEWMADTGLAGALVGGVLGALLGAVLSYRDNAMPRSQLRAPALLAGGLIVLALMLIPVTSLFRLTLELSRPPAGLTAAPTHAPLPRTVALLSQADPPRVPYPVPGVLLDSLDAPTHSRWSQLVHVSLMADRASLDWNEVETRRYLVERTQMLPDIDSFFPALVRSLGPQVQRRGWWDPAVQPPPIHDADILTRFHETLEALFRENQVAPRLADSVQPSQTVRGRLSLNGQPAAHVPVRLMAWFPTQERPDVPLPQLETEIATVLTTEETTTLLACYQAHLVRGDDVVLTDLSDDAGRFVIHDVPDGTYLLAVLLPGDLPPLHLEHAPGKVIVHGHDLVFDAITLSEKK